MQFLVLFNFSCSKLKYMFDILIIWYLEKNQGFNVKWGFAKLQLLFYIYLFIFLIGVLQPLFSNTMKVTPDGHCGCWFIHHTEAPPSQAHNATVRASWLAAAISYTDMFSLMSMISWVGSADTLIILFIRSDALRTQPLRRLVFVYNWETFSFTSPNSSHIWSITQATD